MKMCQCPEWGELHFYGNNLYAKGKDRNCVNALKGATSISTLPLETLVNQGFAGPFFQKFSEYSEKGILKGVFGSSQFVHI